jgi:glycosyltransferase involved in cell wall biosynthesis
MEKILIVSNYYPPEKGAAPNRIGQLAWKLSGSGYDVSVVCPLANYPKGKIFPEYRGRFKIIEHRDGIRVRRLWIYPSNSHNPLKRILSIASFSTCLCFFLLFGRVPKKVVVQSPPLLLSFLAVLCLKIRRRKIILNVSDLWPLAAIELGVLKNGSLSHRILKKLEKFLYKNVTLVLGQSHEIIAHVKSIVPDKSCYLYRNLPDHSRRDFRHGTHEGKIRLFYAGLLGVAQDVLEVCEKLEYDSLKFEFHIFGDGAQRAAIEAYIEKHREKNIIFHGMIDRDELIKKLAGFDIALVPLKTRIYGSVPSKIFEYGALGLPLLYFGGGEGETVVLESGLGWVAKPGDFKSLNEALANIAMMGRADIDKRKADVKATAGSVFDLDAQMKDLIARGVF